MQSLREDMLARDNSKWCFERAPQWCSRGRSSLTTTFTLHHFFPNYCTCIYIHRVYIRWYVNIIHRWAWLRWVCVFILEIIMRKKHYMLNWVCAFIKSSMLHQLFWIVSIDGNIDGLFWLYSGHGGIMGLELFAIASWGGSFECATCVEGSAPKRKTLGCRV